jgi:hypothetical protein
MRDLFERSPESLYEPDNSASLPKAVDGQIRNPRCDYAAPSNWSDSAMALETAVKGRKSE